MEFKFGCDLEEFRSYYRTTRGELDAVEENLIKSDTNHLIIWRINEEIIGHTIWHEATTEEHRKGDPRDEGDKVILRKLLGGKKVFVELHELWLTVEHRGKGYGKKFFEFFEDFISNRGYDSIVYYTDNPAAIALCRQRGYQEAYYEEEKWYTFHKKVKK